MAVMLASNDITVYKNEHLITFQLDATAKNCYKLR